MKGQDKNLREKSLMKCRKITYPTECSKQWSLRCSLNLGEQWTNTVRTSTKRKCNYQMGVTEPKNTRREKQIHSCSESQKNGMT